MGQPLPSPLRGRPLGHAPSPHPLLSPSGGRPSGRSFSFFDLQKISRRTPIRWLILGYYLLILTITLGLLSFIIYSMVSRFLWFSNESRLRTAVESGWFLEVNEDETSHHLRGAGLPAPLTFPAEADELARRLSGRWMYVRILDPRGYVLAENGRSFTPPPVDMNRIEKLRDLVLAGEGRRWRVSYLAGGRSNWQVLLIPVTRRERLVGIVQVCGLYRPAQELLSALGGYLLLGGLGAVLLATLITLAVARFLAHPMEKVIVATRRVRSGDLSARTGLPEGTNEMYAVASAFDKMVEQLQETFNTQRRFVADASHELKTPLTAIGGMTELLRMGVDRGQPEQREKALATIEKEVDRMTALVADLLTLSSAEQAAPLTTALVDLRPVLLEIFEQSKLVWTQHRFELGESEGAAGFEALPVRGDREQLARIFGNLLDNAAKYSSAESTIVLTASLPPSRSIQGGAGRGGSAPEWVKVEVQDQGVGISEADLPRIFDRFYRVDSSRTRKTGGSGLGLSIVRALVEQHGGRVSCQSVYGEGTTFTVLLPRAQA